MKRKIFTIIGLILLIPIAIMSNRLAGLLPGPTFHVGKRAAADSNVQIIADNLEAIWSVAFASDGRIFLTERPGRVRIIQNGMLRQQPALSVSIPGNGEGGLQGMALDPNFTSNHFIYLYQSYTDSDKLLNQVVRYREDANTLVEPNVLLAAIPGNTLHNGGRLAFGPDQKLYVATGDSREPSLAQDTNSLAGKILRLNSDGSAPIDNPFSNYVWSYGHRNPQGLAWDSQGLLYETEHGPSGDQTLCCRDEVNKIMPGSNYGWPIVTGDQSKAGLTSPINTSGNFATWAPASAAFDNDNRLYFGSLRGQYLRRLTLNNDKVIKSEELYKNQFGRIRDVVKGPDGGMYFTTSNRDGRGKVETGDDKLIKITGRPKS